MTGSANSGESGQSAGASQISDICIETILRGPSLQLRGGLHLDRNLAVFDSADEAPADARIRLLIVRFLRQFGDGDPATLEMLRDDPVEAAFLDANGTELLSLPLKVKP